jgi:HSP20 family protein
MDTLNIREIGTGIDRFWEDFADLYRETLNTPSFEWYVSTGGDSYYPVIDVVSAKDHYKLIVELPGLTEKDFTVDVKDGILTISGRYPEEEYKEETLVHRERMSGEFCRSLELPDTVDGEHIEAAYKNGLLEIKLPRTEKTTEKHIKVEVH